MICEICFRTMMEDGVSCDDHHLIPKSKRGKDVIRIHKICHRKIHSIWTEKELAEYYNTPARIREYDEMVKFTKWVKKKPPDYYSGTKDSNVRKSKRRR